MSSWKGYVGGFVFNCHIFFTSFLGGIFIMGPSFIILFFNEKWFRWYNDFVARIWFILPGALLELICGTKIVITGDPVNPNDCPLIIMNHRCRLDWMFYWMVQLRIGRLGNGKIILKKELKHLPGPGWCMQNIMFFFLERRWELDERYLNRILGYFTDMNYPLQLFMFPEGTNLCKESIERSHKFAEKNGLVKYNYCLHPRVKGFNYLVQKLRHNMLDCIHDVTIGYPVNLCYGEKDLARGNFPKEVHVYIKRYAMKDIPTDSSGLDEWCRKRWAEKESRLKHFYKDGKFSEQNNRNVSFDKVLDDRAIAAMYFSLAFWALFLLVSFHSLWFYAAARWYAMVMIMFYLVQSFCRGTDALQLYIHAK